MLDSQRIRTLENAALVVSLMAVAAACVKFFDYGYDDAYITYRYAKNIAAGHGFVYNLEHNFLGTTTPLYTLLLAFGGLAFDIPRVSAAFTTLSLLGCIVLVEAIGRRHRIRFAGPLAALTLAASLPIYRVWGTETIFVYFLVVPLGYWLHLTGRTRASAFVLGLAVLARMDAVLFAGLLFGWQAWRERRIPWQEGLVLVATLTPWFIYSLVVFGAPFPSTLGAKVAQGESGGWPLFVEGGLRDFARMVEYRPGWRFFFGGVLAAGLYRIATREPVWAIFVVNAVLFTVAYQWVLGVSFSKWYLANLWVTNALVLGAGVRQVFAWCGQAGAAAIDRGLSGPQSRAVAGTLIGVIVVLLGLAQAQKIARVAWFDTRSVRSDAYTRLGLWLRDHTPDDATVAYYEIGFVGYYSERTILDPVGLVTPGGLEEIRRGNTWWIFDVYEPDYYVHRTHLGPGGPLARPGFLQQYEAVHRLDEPGRGRDLIVYRRRGPDEVDD